LTKLMWGTFPSSDNPVSSNGVAEMIFTNQNHETAHTNFEGFRRHVD
jgi:hypothetical protein